MSERTPHNSHIYLNSTNIPPNSSGMLPNSSTLPPDGLPHCHDAPTDILDIIKLGAFIRACRTAKAMTQQELGDLVGISNKAVSKWERGLSFPDITLLPRLARVLEVTVGEIIYGERIIMPTENKELTELTELTELVEQTVNKTVDKTMAYSYRSYAQKTKSEHKIIFIALLASLILAGSICLAVDYAAGHDIGWSLYPCGALLMIMCTASAALFSRRNKLEWILTALLVTLSIYLLLIQSRSEPGRSGIIGWAVTLGMPIALVVIASIYLIFKSFLRVKNKFYAWANFCLIIAVGPMFLVDIIVKINRIDRHDCSSIMMSSGLGAAVIFYLAGRLRAKTNSKDTYT